MEFLTSNTQIVLGASAGFLILVHLAFHYGRLCKRVEDLNHALPLLQSDLRKIKNKLRIP